VSAPVWVGFFDDGFYLRTKPSSKLKKRSRYSLLVGHSFLGSPFCAIQNQNYGLMPINSLFSAMEGLGFELIEFKSIFWDSFF